MGCRPTRHRHGRLNRRRGKPRPRDQNRESAGYQEPGGYRLSPELTGELELLHRFLRERHGAREPSEAELADAIASLADRLPMTDRLLHELDHNDPDGTTARVLLAAV